MLAGDPFLVVRPISLGFLDVLGLPAFRAAEEEENGFFPVFRAINPVSWAMVNP
jgi:hypothetical protein